MPPTASATIQKTNSDCTESSPNMAQSSDIDKADPPASVEPSSSADNMGTRQLSLPDTDQQSIERQIARKQLEIEILEMQLEPARQQQLKELAQTQRKKRVSQPRLTAWTTPTEKIANAVNVEVGAASSQRRRRGKAAAV